MRKWIGMMVLLLFAGSAFAQKDKAKTRKTPDERAAQFVAKMDPVVALDAGQKKRVHELALERARKMDQLHEEMKAKEKNEANRSAWKAERKKVFGDFQAGIKTTLSPDQYEKWKKHREEQRGKHKAAHKGKHSAQTPEQRATHFTEKVNAVAGLDEAQKKRVHDLMLTNAQKMDQLRGKEKNDAWHAELKKARTEFNEGLKSALRPDQYEKWQKHKQEQRSKHKAAHGKKQHKEQPSGK